MTTPKPPARLSAILLAAGGSKRYGECKQLVEVNGSPLIRLAVDKLLLLFPPDRINIVVGANPEAVTRAISDLSVNIVENEVWQQGLSSSLKAGLDSVDADCQAVLIALCDQVLVTEECLRRLIGLWLTDPSKIAASSYAGTIGTPAVIPAGFYPQVSALEGDTGAKFILTNNTDRVRTLLIPEAEFDLDTPADLIVLEKKLYTTTREP